MSNANSNESNSSLKLTETNSAIKPAAQNGFSTGNLYPEKVTKPLDHDLTEHKNHSRSLNTGLYSNIGFTSKLTNAGGFSKSNCENVPMSSTAEVKQKLEANFPTIGFQHMNMKKFVLVSLCNSFMIRVMIYPTTLIKTRLQCEKSGSGYKNGRDAFRKIIQSEGVRGLYRGFSMYAMSIFSGSCYILTYEYSKHWLINLGTAKTVQNLGAGAAASVVGQTIMVPIDIISQHMMMTGRRDETVHKVGSVKVPKGSSFYFVAQTVYSQYGLCGIYRGYLSSMTLYASNSALWWQFYSMYNDFVYPKMPTSTPSILCNMMCGPMAGLTSSYLTNPLDVIRARMQVEGQPSALATLKHLKETEGLLQGMHKGVSTRMFNACLTSLLITILYEGTKRISLKPEFKGQFKW